MHGSSFGKKEEERGNHQSRPFLIQMSHLEEKLLILRKKKRTAKTIVEQQRNELRLLKSPLTLNERLEEIYQRFDQKRSIDTDLLKKILQQSIDAPPSPSNHQRIHRAIDDLSKLIEQIQRILGMTANIDVKQHPADLVVKKQKESLKSIQWKLADIYAHRVADEVSCITS